MTNITTLLSISSEALGPKPNIFPGWLSPYELGAELFGMLKGRNGFYTFESALHVFPLTSDPKSGLEGWNSDLLWRNEYQDLADGLLFFAEDILQDQFCLSRNKNGVYRFHAETGEAQLMTDSLEKWAGIIVANYRTETGWPLLHEWQEKNGLLPRGKRLMPKTPFFLGGGYTVENLWAGNSLEGMRFKADLAIQTRELPQGSRVKLNVTAKPR